MKPESSNEKLNGEMIKAIRQRYGLSQQEFGARLGVTHAHISKIESGKENPSETLLKLIKYEFKVDKFLGAPSSTVTKPKIKQYLNILEDLMLKHKKVMGAYIIQNLCWQHLLQFIEIPTKAKCIRNYCSILSLA